jgi:hypothetical protein
VLSDEPEAVDVLSEPVEAVVLSELEAVELLSEDAVVLSVVLSDEPEAVVEVLSDPLDAVVVPAVVLLATVVVVSDEPAAVVLPAVVLLPVVLLSVVLPATVVVVVVDLVGLGFGFGFGFGLGLSGRFPGPKILSLPGPNNFFLLALSAIAKRHIVTRAIKIIALIMVESQSIENYSDLMIWNTYLYCFEIDFRVDLFLIIFKENLKMNSTAILY